MLEYGVLTNRKRALIALIHSLVFLGVACAGFASTKTGMLNSGRAATSDIVLLVIYAIVASILTWLVTISRNVRERLYFALCTTSATFGLLRTIFGDTTLPVAQYVRVIMLSSAVLVGTSIYRSFARPEPQAALPE